MRVQACPGCDRQYDVGALRPGRRIHCACERVFPVEAAPELVAPTLRCSNCGATVRPGERGAGCAYCGAAMPARPPVGLCPRCFARLDEGARHCSQCGVRVAPQALAPLPEGAACPRCAGELQHRALARFALVECGACQGVWVRAADFEAIVAEAQDRPEVKVASPLERVAEAEPERKVEYIRCLACGERMNRRMFRYKELPSRVVLDVCREHGVWLDRDELERVVAFVRSRVDVELPLRPVWERPERAPRALPELVVFDRQDLGQAILARVLGGLVGGILR